MKEYTKKFRKSEICIITISSARYMTYEYLFENLMEAVDLKFNMISDGNPHLIVGLHRNVIHPLIQKYTFVTNKAIFHLEEILFYHDYYVFSHLLY